MKIYHLTHNDMDGVGCMFSVERFAASIGAEYVYENVGYGDIKEAITRLKGDIIFITDLNFSDEEVDILINKIQKEKLRVVYIDHHHYPQEKLDLLAKYTKLTHNEQDSATLLTFNKLKDKFEYTEDMQKIIEIIDVYDAWKFKDKRFELARMINKCFWEFGLEKFYKTLKYDFKIPHNWKVFIKTIKENNQKIYKKLEETGAMIKTDNILFIPRVDIISDIQFDYPGFNLYMAMGIDSRKMSVRIPFEFEKKEALRAFIIEEATKYPEVEGAGGHIEAFGITFKKDIDEQKFIDICLDIAKKADLWFSE